MTGDGHPLNEENTGETLERSQNRTTHTHTQDVELELAQSRNKVQATPMSLIAEDYIRVKFWKNSH